MNLDFRTRRTRIALLICAVWLIAALAIAFGFGDSCYEGRCFFSVSGFAIAFLIIGVLPVVMLWGVMWVLAGAPKDTQTTQNQDLMAGSTVANGPACPACGAPTKLRITRTGQYAGTYFWGCTNYPNCVRIVPLTNPRR